MWTKNHPSLGNQLIIGSVFPLPQHRGMLGVMIQSALANNARRIDTEFDNSVWTKSHPYLGSQLIIGGVFPRCRGMLAVMIYRSGINNSRGITRSLTIQYGPRNIPENISESSQAIGFERPLMYTVKSSVYCTQCQKCLCSKSSSTAWADWYSKGRILRLM